MQFAKKVGCIIARQGGCWRTEANASAAKKCIALHTSERFSQSVGDDALALSYALIHNMHRCRAALVGRAAAFCPFHCGQCDHCPLLLDHRRPWADTRCAKMQAAHPKGTQCWGRPADAAALALGASAPRFLVTFAMTLRLSWATSRAFFMPGCVLG